MGVQQNQETHLRVNIVESNFKAESKDGIVNARAI